MATLKMTLRDILRDEKILEETRQKREAEAKALLEKLETANFRHNDTHQDNFMEGVDGKLYYGLSVSKNNSGKVGGDPFGIRKGGLGWIRLGENDKLYGDSRKVILAYFYIILIKR